MYYPVLVEEGIKRFYRCIITKVHDDGTYDILYVDDKKKGTNVPPEHIKKYNPPPSITSHWSVIVTENDGNKRELRTTNLMTSKMISVKPVEKKAI